MALEIKITESFIRDLDKLDKLEAQRVLNYINKKVKNLDDPRSLGSILKGDKLGDYWRYRVGNYRIIVNIDYNPTIVLILGVAKRDEVYK